MHGQPRAGQVRVWLRRGRRTALAVLAVGAVTALAAPAARADAVVVGPDLTCGILWDTSECGALMVGDNCVDVCQGARALVRFDLAGIPAYSTITSATLDLGADPNPPNDFDIQAHTLTAPWNGNATWMTTDGETPWTGPAGYLGGGADGDYDDAQADVLATVAQWVSGERPNFGLIFIAPYGGRGWNDFEEINPTLTIEYTPPPAGWIDGEPPSEDVGDVDADDPLTDHDPANDPAVGEFVPDRDDEPANLIPAEGLARGPIGSRWTLDTDPEGGWVTARNKAQQFYIGAGKDGWTFDAAYSSDERPGYLWGWLYGQYKYCGWMNVKLLANARAHDPTHCVSRQTIPPVKIASIVNCDQCNSGTGIRIERATDGYRNLRPWGGDPSHYSLTNHAKHYEPGDRVAWRYVTADNRYVAVSDGDIPSAANWEFLPRSVFNLPHDTVGPPSQMCTLSHHGTNGRKATSPTHGDWPAVCIIGEPPS